MMPYAATHFFIFFISSFLLSCLAGCVASYRKVRADCMSRLCIWFCSIVLVRTLRHCTMLYRTMQYSAALHQPSSRGRRSFNHSLPLTELFFTTYSSYSLNHVFGRGDETLPCIFLLVILLTLIPLLLC
jgi:hypothetical protein